MSIELIKENNRAMFVFFTEDIYKNYMCNLFEEQYKTSNKVREKLFKFLDNDLNDLDLSEYRKYMIVKMKEYIRVNNKEKGKLIRNLSEKFVVTDLNSAVMGVPNDSDSDLDFTIPVKNKEEQEEVENTLLKMGYKLDNEWDEDIESDIKWKSYQKFVDNIEIEVKIRDEKVVRRVLIAHNGIKGLEETRKLKVSFVKSTLLGCDKKIYKTFKYILYSAMFNGNKDTIIFRH